MSDVVLEVIRAIVVLVIFVFLFISGKKIKISKQPGWTLVLVGFGLIFFASVLDITDNFEALNKYVVIGDTQYQAFFEKVVGYLFGFLALAVGLWRWIPIIEHSRIVQEETQAQYKKLEKTLKKKNRELEESFESMLKVNTFMVNREVKMVELKKEIAKLKKGK